MSGIVISGALGPGYDTILTPDAVEFVAHLARAYTPRVEELLSRRAQVQARFDAGGKPQFPPETQFVREGDWKVCFCPVTAKVTISI